MPTSWPPVSAPAWTGMQASDLATLLLASQLDGWTDAAPTNAENTAYFNAVRCDLGHPVVGRMLVEPGTGTRFPFAGCNQNHNPADPAGQQRSRALFFLWPPHYLNSYSTG